MLREAQAALVHGWNQQQALQRAQAAVATGLDPRQYGSPLPGSTVTTVTNNSGGGIVKGLLLGAATLAAGGGTAGALFSSLRPTPPAAAIVAPAKNTVQQLLDAVYERQEPDGSWRPLRLSDKSRREIVEAARRGANDEELRRLAADLFKAEQGGHR